VFDVKDGSQLISRLGRLTKHRYNRDPHRYQSKHASKSTSCPSTHNV
jgi:hypothetical protein